MNKDLEKEIMNFMDNLEFVNELHHPNDYRRLYNIALIACKNNEVIPYDLMQEKFNNAISERKLNEERFCLAYPEYIHTLEIAYDILKRMFDMHVVFPESMRF